MSSATLKRPWLAVRLWRRLRGVLVEEVPAGLDICQFDCGKTDCRLGDWEKCERRLRGDYFAAPRKDTR